MFRKAERLPAKASQRTRITPAARIAACLLPVMTGCQPAAPPRTTAELTPQQLRGREIFVSRCADCHSATSNQGPHGPGLVALYRKNYLPSGAPANDDRVSATVLHGRGMMPAFGNNLEEQQLNELLAYLHTL